MYRIDELYKFHLDNNIFYTGYIIKEDSFSVLIKTTRNEEIILNKKNIVQSKKMDRIGVKDGAE